MIKSNIIFVLTSQERCHVNHGRVPLVRDYIATHKEPGSALAHTCLRGSGYITPGQVDQVLAALTGLTATFAGAETTVLELRARQVALESARVTRAATVAAAKVAAEVMVES